VELDGRPATPVEIHWPGAAAQACRNRISVLPEAAAFSEGGSWDLPIYLAQEWIDTEGHV